MHCKAPAINASHTTSLERSITGPERRKVSSEAKRRNWRKDEEMKGSEGRE